MAVALERGAAPPHGFVPAPPSAFAALDETYTASVVECADLMGSDERLRRLVGCRLRGSNKQQLPAQHLLPHVSAELERAPLS